MILLVVYSRIPQGDAIRKSVGYGEVDMFMSGWTSGTGVFAKTYTYYRSRDQSSWSWAPTGRIVFDMSSAGPMADEVRVVNMAVKYHIRAIGG